MLYWCWTLSCSTWEMQVRQAVWKGDLKQCSLGSVGRRGGGASAPLRFVFSFFRVPHPSQWIGVCHVAIICIGRAEVDRCIRFFFFVSFRRNSVRKCKDGLHLNMNPQTVRTFPNGVVVPGVVTTGWFKHMTPNSFRVQCPRRFCEETLKFFCTRVWCAPAEPCTFFFFFLPDIWGFYFFRYLGLLRYPHFQRKNKTKHSYKARH